MPIAMVALPNEPGRARAACLALLLALPACLGGTDGPADPLPGSGIAVGTGDYAEGPYGTTEGQVLANLLFEGYAQPADGIGEGRRVELPLSTFYNPTGAATYGPGELLPEGTARPQALVINGGAVWCSPCKAEAAELLPKEYAALHPKGLELLFIMVESIEQGKPASFSDLDNWISAFDLSYPAVLDPTNQMSFETTTFPSNVLIDTRTMTIVESVKGIPQDSFWTLVEQVATE